MQHKLQIIELRDLMPAETRHSSKKEPCSNSQSYLLQSQIPVQKRKIIFSRKHIQNLGIWAFFVLPSWFPPE